MKKINGKKLALNRETLASLNPDVLGDVVGGQAAGLTTITGPLTRNLCPPSRLVCPPKTLLACPPQAGGGGAKGGE